MAIEGEGLAWSSSEEAPSQLDYSDPDMGWISGSICDHIPRRSDVPRVAVMIPAYNEELTIGSVVIEARKHAHHVLVVNDGSRDRTSEIARAAGAEVIDHLHGQSRRTQYRL